MVHYSRYGYCSISSGSVNPAARTRTQAKASLGPIGTASGASVSYNLHSLSLEFSRGQVHAR